MGLCEQLMPELDAVVEGAVPCFSAWFLLGRVVLSPVSCHSHLIIWPQLLPLCLFVVSLVVTLLIITAPP